MWIERQRKKREGLRDSVFLVWEERRAFLAGSRARKEGQLVASRFL